MGVIEETEKRYYEDDSEESLRVYAESLSAAGEALGTLITMELEANIDPQESVHRSYPAIYKLRAQILVTLLPEPTC